MSIQQIECDIAIIGGGPGGYVAALKAAKLGAEVVLVEKEALGGTCLNWGCIPTKALVRSAEVYNNLKKAGQFGCYAENISVDIKKVIERKNDAVNRLVQGIRFLLNKQKVKVINGTGELLDAERIYVKNGMDGTEIKAKDIIIATGSRTVNLNIPGIDNENVLTSSQVLEIQELPGKMAIIGGGVIGMEFAFIFANFGVEVSVIEYLDECLSNCGMDVCKELGRAAAKKGIKLYKGAKVEEIMQNEDGECIVAFSRKDGERKQISTGKVLMAVGREPFIDGLGIEKAGIELNKNGKGIQVNSRMQTNIPNIYAIGDVTNKIQLAHVASHQGIIAARNIMGESCEMDYNVVPNAIFTDPEIAMVGVSEEAARKDGLDIEIGKFPFAANGKAVTLGEISGFVKVIEDKTTGKIIGGTIIGPHATDLIAEIALAVGNGLTAEQVAETIHAHPTAAEAVYEAVLGVTGGALHFAG